MLMDFFRRHEKLVFWGLLPVIVIPFVFVYGGPGGLHGDMSGENRTLAEILRRKITTEDAAQEALRLFGGVDANWARHDTAALTLALNRLLYVSAVEESGLRVADAEVDQALEKLRTGTASLPASDWRSFDGPAFDRITLDDKVREGMQKLVVGPNCRFAAAFRERAAAWNAGRLRRADHECLREAVREELLLLRHEKLMTDAAKVTSAELYRAYLEQHTRLRVRWAKADAKAFEALVPAADLGEEALKRRFDEEKDKGYQVPDRAEVAWILADTERISKEFPVDPADVESFYGDPLHKDYWKDPQDEKKVIPLEKVRDKIVMELNRQKVLDRMNDAMFEALAAPADEDFGKLAARLNLQSGSGTVDVSDYPTLEGPGMVEGLGELLKELDPGAKAPRSLDCGKGRVVVRLLSRAHAHAPEFKDVREKVLSDLKAKRGREMAEDALRRIKASAGESLEAPKPLTSGITDPFTDPRVGDAKLPDAISRHRDAAVAAFALEKPGDCTDPLFDDEEGIVLQVAERMAPPPEGFAEARKGLAQRGRNAMAQMLMRDWRKAVGGRARLYGMPKEAGAK